MRLLAESTTKTVTFKIGCEEVPARIWEAVTEAGVPCRCERPGPRPRPTWTPTRKNIICR